MDYKEKHVSSVVAIVAVVILFTVIAWHQKSDGRLNVRDEKSVSTSHSNLRLLDEPYPLPDISFQDSFGRNTKLSDFHGKIVLLNIWATWCSPCREEMPALDRLQARLGSKDFLVLPVSTDTGGVDQVQDFYTTASIKSLGVYVDPTGKAEGDLRIIGYPTTFVVDRKGRAIGLIIGPAEWDSNKMINKINIIINDSAR
jgi:thiol-disulfide isomerase/thioredoxin